MGIDNFISDLWNAYVADWGYLILFIWSIMEGELGLIFAGIAAHTGHLNLFLSIIVAGLGGFVGDQIYFYIGRCNKNYLQNKLKKQRRKLALAHLLLNKYGWSIIFIQRYMYGMRTIIPISIGLTRYSAIKFAIINFISAIIWASITIVLAWIFGDTILSILLWFKKHPYILAIFLLLLICVIIYYFKTQTSRVNRKLNKLSVKLNQSNQSNFKGASND